MNKPNSTDSSAEIIRKKLARYGIDTAQIRQDHLFLVYSNLQRLPSAPDFVSIKPLLRGLRVPAEICDDQVMGVIVETRRHPKLASIVRHFVDHLNISVQVFHGQSNGALLRSWELDGIRKRGKLKLVALSTDTLTAAQYNGLLLSSEFWNALRGRKKILIFQTDAICCRNADYALTDFMQFDYLGSLWGKRRPVGLTIRGGSGGLSLRDWQCTVDCLERFSPLYWVGGEDGYFAFHMDLMGMCVGDDDASARFSTQEKFLTRSWGAHQIQCLSPRELGCFLSYCPDALQLLLER